MYEGMKIYNTHSLTSCRYFVGDVMLFRQHTRKHFTNGKTENQHSIGDFKMEARWKSRVELSSAQLSIAPIDYDFRCVCVTHKRF